MAEEKGTRLSSREKIVGGSLGAVFILFLLYQFLIAPPVRTLRTLREKIPRKEKDLQELVKLSEEYRRLSQFFENKGAEFKPSSENASLLTLLEELATQVGIRRNLVSILPVTKSTPSGYREVSVEAKVEGITLEQLTQYLYRIEKASPGLTVRRLQIKSGGKGALLNSSIEVVRWGRGEIS